MDMEKLNELLNDLNELGAKDGYASTRAEYCDDSMVAEDCLDEYKEFAEKYGIDFEEYTNDLDYDDFEYDYEFAEAIWDRQVGLSWKIEKIIKKQIMDMVGGLDE